MEQGARTPTHPLQGVSIGLSLLLLSFEIQCDHANDLSVPARTQWPKDERCILPCKSINRGYYWENLSRDIHPAGTVKYKPQTILVAWEPPCPWTAPEVQHSSYEGTMGKRNTWCIINGQLMDHFWLIYWLGNTFQFKILSSLYNSIFNTINTVNLQQQI